MSATKACGALAAALCLTFAAATASAFTVDTKVGSALLANQAVETEETALEAAIGGGIDLELSDDQPLGGSFGPFANDADSWYLDVNPLEPGYFVLKFGVPNNDNLFPAGTHDTYFFKNIAELTKLVWSNAQVNFLSGGCGVGACNIERLSHYRITDGGGTTPEPATLALVGLALAGIGAFARSRR